MFACYLDIERHVIMRRCRAISLQHEQFSDLCHQFSDLKKSHKSHIRINPPSPLCMKLKVLFTVLVAACTRGVLTPFLPMDTDFVFDIFVHSKPRHGYKFVSAKGLDHHEPLHSQGSCESMPLAAGLFYLFFGSEGVNMMDFRGLINHVTQS